MQCSSRDELPSGSVSVPYRIGPHTIIMQIIIRMRTAIYTCTCNSWAGPRNAVCDLPTLCSTYSQASCVIASGFRTVLDLDTYPLINLIRPRYAERVKPAQGKPVLIRHIRFFACFHTISKIATFCACSTEAVGIDGIAHKPPRSL